MKIQLIKWIVLYLFLWISFISAEEESGGYAGSFLDWGAGARAISMGKTFSAIASDGTALIWNPAGFAGIDTREVTMMHALIFEDRSENYVAFTLPLSNFTLSAGWLRFGVSNIQERDQFGQLISHFSDSENAFMLGAGTTIYSNNLLKLNLGTTIKYFHHSLYNYKATGLGADIGSLVHFQLSGLIKTIGFAVVIQNIGAKLKWDTASNHEDKIPINARIGSIMQINAVPLKIVFDLEKNEKREMLTHVGTEYWWQILAIRIGMNQKHLTAGAGIVFKLSDDLGFIIDYAYTDDDIADNGLHFFSLSLRF
jgi:hypothetical protein